MTRGAVSLARRAEDAHGDLLCTCTKPWSDGTTGITLAPLELLEKLAALVPLPRVHLVRYGGCLAPHSQWGAEVRPRCVPAVSPGRPEGWRGASQGRQDGC